MNKYTLFFVLLTGTIFLAGCTSQTPQTETTQSFDSASDQSVGEVVSQWQEVANAIAAGKSAHCEITNAETQEKGDYYMKGERIRYSLSNPTDASKNASFLTDSEYTYSWSEDTKQGMKFKIATQQEIQKPEEIPGEQQQTPDFSQEDAWNSYQELGYSVDCSVESVSDDMFTPPNDVTFSDFSDFLEMTKSGS